MTSKHDPLTDREWWPPLRVLAQPQLDFSKPVAVIARRDDPATSKLAAATFSQKRAQRSVQTVVAILTDAGALSDFEIAQHWPRHWPGPFSHSLPAKARHWARQAGLVKLAGEGKHRRRTVRTWELGRDVLHLAEHAAPKACPHCGNPIA